MSHYVSRTLAARRREDRTTPGVGMAIMGVLVMTFGSGFLLGQQDRPFGTEQSVARELSRDSRVELIGFGCGPMNVTALLPEEDGFGADCREIRRLDEEKEFI